jgi:hypothetical protein
MTVFRINLVASYEPTEPMVPPEYPLLDAGPALKTPDTLLVWGERVVEQAREGTSRLRLIDVTMTEDHNILPARLTMTLACEIDALTEWDARTDATALFREECEAAELPAPESVVANPD